MRVLIDTHAFLWWNTEDPLLSLRARDIIANGHNEVFLSVASVWEISIKTAKGRLILPAPPAEYITSRMRLNRFSPLPVAFSHAVHIYELPPHHQDPFDRLLIAQSMLESLTLVTNDEDIKKYAVETIW